MQRVHDKKLSILALCSLLELPLSSLPVALSPMWTHLVSDGLMPLFSTYSSALTGKMNFYLILLLISLRYAAVERRRMETGDYQDEDYSDFDENGFLDDDNDSEFADDDENIETLVQSAATHAPDGESDDEESDDEMWDVEEFLQEDISFSTVIESIDAYAALNHTLDHLVSTGQSAVLEVNLSLEQKTLLASFLKNSEKEPDTQTAK